MAHGLSELSDNEEIDTEYDDPIRVVKVNREDQPPLYRFEARNHEYKASDLGPVWENPHDARLYAAVYVVTRFREEKTGKRGIPPAVEQAGREELICYTLCRKGTSVDWIVNKYDLPKQRIYEYKSRVMSRAEERSDMITGGDE